MNRIGMTVDLSHVGDRSSLEAIEISEKPCIFSHSNPRSRVDALRNITDEQMREVAARGGVVELTTYPPLNWRGSKAIPHWMTISTTWNTPST
jgi:membrane dipeptidase